MSKEELLKAQTCVLKVGIHCYGCERKVKKILQKIEGVYTVKIESEQGKVTVSGNVDSSTLLKKLIKNGKHAEILALPKNEVNNQPKNLKIDNGKVGDNKGNQAQKDNSNNKGGGDPKNNSKNQAKKGVKTQADSNSNTGKNQNATKSVKFKLQEDKEVDSDESDDDDEDEDVVPLLNKKKQVMPPDVMNGQIPPQPIKGGNNGKKGGAQNNNGGGVAGNGGPKRMVGMGHMPRGPMGQMGPPQMGQRRNLGAVQGLPVVEGGGRGYFQGGCGEHMAVGNPYYQQPMAAMMMNQQRVANYMPQYPIYYYPPRDEGMDHFTMFSDENTSGCAVM